MSDTSLITESRPDNKAFAWPADPVAISQWYAIGALNELAPGITSQTQLLGQVVSYRVDGNAVAAAWCYGPSGQVPLAARVRYGYIWVCPVQATRDLFEIPEYDETDRRNLNAGSVGVYTSAPRVIENFLDMGHFPFVHDGILGAQPHTEVKDYDVEIFSEPNEILATQCRFFQPMASAASGDGADVDYVYRVPHPYCAILYKSSPTDGSRMDAIAIFLQPMTQERTRAHMLLSVLDNTNSNNTLRHFQQLIFGQDKPILENQVPKRLPLYPGAETPVRADRTSIAYRGWLQEMGLQYGVIATPHST